MTKEEIVGKLKEWTEEPSYKVYCECLDEMFDEAYRAGLTNALEILDSEIDLADTAGAFYTRVKEAIAAALRKGGEG